MRTIALGLGLSAVLLACGGGGGEAAQPSTPSAGAEPQTFAEQVSAGQKLYGENCASCHGSGGEGSSGAPKVVGLDKGALPLDPPAGAKVRKQQFHNAGDIADFVVHNMPPGEAGKLKEWQYWSILAFDLHANGVDLPKKLDSSNAKEVTVHK